LPKAKWLKNYKQADMADVFDDGELPKDLADEDDAAIKAK